MTKYNVKFLVCALVLVLCAVFLCVPAFASAEGFYYDFSQTPPPSETVAPTAAPAVETVSPAVNDLLTAFTPEGNLTLVDDFSRTVTDSDGNERVKQFITVQSKSGNYFYIVIDRAGNGENVYFLNLVDEADLASLTKTDAEETPPVCTCKTHCSAGHIDTTCPVCAVNMTECAAVDPTPTPTIPPTAEPSSAPENPNHGSAGGSILAVLLTAAILIGGVYYYVRTKRKAPSNVKGGTDLDEYDYGQEDDEEYAFYDERSHDEENE